jgi:signal transduction histidine kinase
MKTSSSPWVVHAASIAALAVVYAIVGRLGLFIEPVAGFATLVWPPSGIAVAALVRRGRVLWPGVALGAFAVNLLAGAPVLVALGIAAGNTIAAVLAAEGLRRASFDSGVGRVRDVLALVIIAAVLSTIASASIGVLSLHLGGLAPSSELPTALRAWWLGDGMGDLVVAPLLLVWSAPARLAPSASSALAMIGVGVTSVVAALAVFGGVLSLADEGGSMYLLFPPLVWAAVRFGQRGATLSVAAVAAIAVLGTISGHGPFTRDGLPILLSLQSFMAVVATVSLLLGAAITERDRARSEALDAARAREDFVAIASHELRTPLATLVLLIGVLKRRQLAAPALAEVTPELKSAERQTERLAQLLGDLVDASRLESGPLRIERKPADLAVLVREAVDRLAERAASGQRELRVSIDGPVPGAWDQARLAQVVTSLVGNALRHAPEGPIEIALTADDARATLVVRDHGPGIAPDRLGTVFARYQRGGAKRERGGMGLGLAIARGIVDAHGGSIRAESADGGGARIVVQLPRT